MVLSVSPFVGEVVLFPGIVVAQIYQIFLEGVLLK